MIHKSVRWLTVNARRVAKKLKSIKNIKVRTLDVGEKPKDNEKEYERNAYKVPPDIKPLEVFIEKGLTDEQLLHAINSFQKIEENIEKNDVSDKYIVFNLGHGSMSTIRNPDYRETGEVDWGDMDTPIYPDDFTDRYYPAGKINKYDNVNGKKPDLKAIIQWVTDVKLVGKSQRALEGEYRRIYGVSNVNWDDDKYKSLVKSIAYLVSRKIWYVGRKPSWMKDDEWDMETRDMRPEEGSFSKNERWVNGFTYNKEYSYSSGEDDHH